MTLPSSSSSFSKRKKSPRGNTGSSSSSRFRGPRIAMGFMVIVASLWMIVMICDSSHWFPAQHAMLQEAVSGVHNGGSTKQQQPPNDNNDDSLLVFSDDQALQNSRTMQQWRKEFQELCHDDISKESDLLSKLSNIVKTTTKSSSSSDPERQQGVVDTDITTTSSLSLLRRCQYVFVDFGANVGDSMQKFISSGIPKCLTKLSSFHPRYNATTGSASTSFRGGNMLVSWSWNRIHDYYAHYYSTSEMKQQEQLLNPEDYCYYGIEGNPLFTDRLRQLQHGAMQLRPRPLRFVHMFTETVGAGNDGPTTLYLDTINTKQNAWGSSLLQSHKDVQASISKQQQQQQDQASTNSNKADGAEASSSSSSTTQVEAKVQGMTLGTLLTQVVDTSSSAHVMIKMDIEGGEFALLEQAAFDPNETVCNMMRISNVQMDVIVEVHNENITGPRSSEEKERYEKAKTILENCGMKLYNVRDAGR